MDIAPIDEHELAVYASLVDTYSVHDGMLVATHRALETDGVLSNDRALLETGVETVWD